MTATIRSELDRVDKLVPGTGRLDLGIGASGTFGEGKVFGFLDVEARPEHWVSLFARGELGYDWGMDQSYWAMLGGLRVRF